MYYQCSAYELMYMILDFLIIQQTMVMCWLNLQQELTKNYNISNGHTPIFTLIIAIIHMSYYTILTIWLIAWIFTPYAFSDSTVLLESYTYTPLELFWWLRAADQFYLLHYVIQWVRMVIFTVCIRHKWRWILDRQEIVCTSCW